MLVLHCPPLPAVRIQGFYVRCSGGEVCGIDKVSRFKVSLIDWRRAVAYIGAWRALLHANNTGLLRLPDQLCPV